MNRQLALCVLFSITIVAAGCSSATVDHKEAEYPDESLTNTYWKLVEVDGAPITARENFREAHMVLHLDASRLAGSTGCNTLMGSYQVKNERITFNQVATTKMACPAAQMKTERDFLATLEQAATWSVNGAALVLMGANSKPLANFEAVHLY